MSQKKPKDVSRKDMTNAQWTWHLMKQNWFGYAFVLPFMILFITFTAVPVVASLFLSLTSYNLIQPPTWVGFDNYVQLFLDDDLFITALKNTLIFAVAVGPASYILSFGVAWFINELPPKARAVITLIFYAPSICSAYSIFAYFFDADAYGLVNSWMLKLGFIDAPIRWFQDTQYIMPLCIAVALWMSLGTAFLSFIAGLQGVDKSQYEAAAVDGVTNRWQELWYVTLPNMKNQLMFGAVMSITGAFGFGDVVTLLAGNPSTDYCAYTLSHHYGEYAGTRWEIGYGSAISLVMFFLCMGANLLINKMLSKVGQ
ncbi:MAG: sugar ABC transporter permease [Ruminococcaceae bacterium]|nr:sugar ABC transporter permease [Oscillospiraceae bacterium]